MDGRVPGTDIWLVEAADVSSFFLVQNSVTGNGRTRPASTRRREPLRIWRFQRTNQGVARLFPLAMGLFVASQFPKTTYGN
jgi:hypothetical protein